MTVTLGEAKERFEELTRCAARGDEVLITDGGKAAYRLLALALAGQAADCKTLDDPMDEEWLDLFYNGPVFPDSAQGAAEPIGSAKPPV